MSDYGTICAILDRWTERWKPQHDTYMAEAKARGFFQGSAPPADDQLEIDDTTRTITIRRGYNGFEVVLTFDGDGNLNDVGAYE